jgi:hypothetical protein
VRNTSYAPEIVRGWVEQRFSVDIMVQRYIELYRGILTAELDPDAKVHLVNEVAA